MTFIWDGLLYQFPKLISLSIHNVPEHDEHCFDNIITWYYGELHVPATGNNIILLEWGWHGGSSVRVFWETHIDWWIRCRILPTLAPTKGISGAFEITWLYPSLFTLVLGILLPILYTPHVTLRYSVTKSLILCNIKIVQWNHRQYQSNAWSNLVLMWLRGWLQV